MLGWTGKNFAADANHNGFLTPTENGTKVRTEESVQGLLMSITKKKIKTI